MDAASAITGNSAPITAPAIRSGSGHIDTQRAPDSLPSTAQNREIAASAAGRIGSSQEDIECIIILIAIF